MANTITVNLLTELSKRKSGIYELAVILAGKGLLDRVPGIRTSVAGLCELVVGQELSVGPGVRMAAELGIGDGRCRR